MRNILNVIWVLFWLTVFIFEPFSVLGLVGMAVFFIHILEIIIFWKRIYSQESDWARIQIKNLENVGIIHTKTKTLVNEIKKFQCLVEQRLNGKPISRIINKRDFWKHEFKLNEETLDPRPDSETLI